MPDRVIPGETAPSSTARRRLSGGARASGIIAICLTIGLNALDASAKEPPGPRFFAQDVYDRTAMIRVPGTGIAGSAFFVYVGGREYLVTAGHVIKGLRE